MATLLTVNRNWSAIQPVIETPPEFPAFTNYVIKNGILREPLRIIDVGCQGGLHTRWRWLGDQLEALAFDPLPEVIEALSAKDPRQRYFCMGLGNDDGQRLFGRTPQPYSSAFLPAAVDQDRFAQEQGSLPDYWSRATIRRLDSLFAEGVFRTADHIKLDCEGFEIEVLRGAQMFLRNSGVFAVESESNLKRHEWHKPCHFAELYGLLEPHGFDVYDIYFYRDTRTPMQGGYPHRGRPDTFDFLFLRGFGTGDDLSAYTEDQIIKRAIVAELYALQDVAADIMLRAESAVRRRLDTKKAVELLRLSYSG